MVEHFEVVMIRKRDSDQPGGVEHQNVTLLDNGWLEINHPEEDMPNVEYLSPGEVQSFYVP